MKAKVFIPIILCTILSGSIIYPQEKLEFHNQLRETPNLYLNSIEHLIAPQFTKNSVYKNQSGYFLDSIYLVTLGYTATKVEFLYDTQRKLSSYVHSTWDGNKWIPDWREIKTYNSEGKLLTSINEDQFGNQWKPNTRQTYTYDSLGRQVNYLIEQRKDEQWNNSIRDSSIYDSLGNEIESISENWVDTCWLYSSKITISYLENGLKASYLIEKWSDNNWNKNIEGVFEYNAQENLITTTVRQWNGTEWLISARATITYENNNRTEQRIQIWDSTQWINSDRMVFSYDENSCRKNGKYEIWSNEHWLPAIGPIVFDVTDEFRIGFITNEINFYYSSATEVSGEGTTLKAFKLFQNYPNPFNPTTKIKYSVPSNVNHRASNISLKVYDVLGREIATLVNEEKLAGEYEVQFDGSGLPSGIYFYQLKAGEYVETKKFVLMK